MVIVKSIVKPLDDRKRKEIQKNIDKILDANINNIIKVSMEDLTNDIRL